MVLRAVQSLRTQTILGLIRIGPFYTVPAGRRLGERREFSAEFLERAVSRREARA
jgi:hypothetical protein